MKKRLLAAALLFCNVLLHLHAQNIFNKQYLVSGETSDAVAHTVTADGGAIIAAVHHPDATVNYYIGIIKTDSDGTIQWSKKIPTVRPGFRNIVQSADGSYFLCYSEFQFGHYFEALHLDANGNLLFDKRINLPTGYQATWEVISAPKTTGGYYIAGSVRDTANGMYYWNLTELSSSGMVSWSSNFNSDYFLGGLYGMQLCANGDLLLLGNHYNTSSQCYDGMITRVTGSGSFLWTKQYAFSGHDLYPANAAETGSDFVVSVQDYQQSAGLAAVDFLKIDGTGALTWVMRYTSTGPNSSLLPYDLLTGGGNDFTVVALRSGTATGSVLLKVDASGQYITSRFYPQYTIRSIEQHNAWQYSLAGTRDSINEHYITLLTTDLNGAGCADTLTAFGLGPVTYVVTNGSNTVSFPITAVAGNLTPVAGSFTEFERCNLNGITEADNPDDLIRVYPSPASEHVTITSDRAISILEVCDLNGRCLQQQLCNASQVELNTAELSNGIYLLRMQMSSGIAVRRLAVMH